jgi:hypothetical protein
MPTVLTASGRATLMRPRLERERKAVKVRAGGVPTDLAALPAGGTSLLQARTVNEVVKAQTNKVRLARLKGELVIGRRPSPTFSSWRAPSAMRG